jgi:hypothetical protein
MLHRQFRSCVWVTRKHSRQQSLRPRFSCNLEVGNRQVLPIAGAVKENRDLVDLTYDFRVSDETWGATCDSLKTHPTLEVLNLQMCGVAPWLPAVFNPRTQALVDMLKVNISIHTIQLDYRYNEHGLFQESIVPYFKTNRLRPRVCAIQKARPTAYRAKVLGRALVAVRTDPNRFWMLLSGNVAFPSTTATTTAAANLPTPANANRYLKSCYFYRYLDCFYNWCLCCCFCRCS